MSDADFYQILGVRRSASADEIKSAYRELVKRYHPDLFPLAGEKAEATEKLGQINEAYAVLGNAARRQRYDQRFIQVPKTRRSRAPAATKRRKASRPGVHANLRSKMANSLKGRLYFPKKRAGYALAGAMVALVLIYADRSEPRLATVWTLLEKLEVTPASLSRPEGTGEGWVRLGAYASVSECAAIIKRKVRMDEQEGSRAVLDEQNGTMAITLYVKKETAQARGDSNFQTDPERSTANEGAPKDEQRQLEQQAAPEGIKSIPKSTMIKRVRSLECRATQRVETESRLRRTLKSVGLLFSAK